MKKKRILGLLLSFVMVLGLMSGMSITAFAASYETVEIASSVYNSSSVSELVASMDGFVSLSFEEAKAWDPPTKSGYERLIRGYDGEYIRITIFNNGQYVNDAGITLEMAQAVNAKYYYAKNTVVAVNSVTLSPANVTLTAGGEAVAMTATVSPNNATDKTVKWSVSSNAVTLYSDSNCTSPITTGTAISTLTVYAKGSAAGSATITVTSNADNTKSTSCTVMVNKANPTAPTGLTATYGQKLSDVILPTGWTWSDSTQSVGSVGSNTFKANYAGNDIYNSKSNVDVTVTVSKAANPANVTNEASVTKGGNTVDLADNVKLNGATGDVGYVIDGEANGCTLNGSVLTSGDNMGNVIVNVTVAEDSNYNALAVTPINVTISDKGTQTIIANDVNATYGDTDKSVGANVSKPATGGGAISYAVKEGSGDYIEVNASTGALTINAVPADGKAYVTVTAAETATYAKATKDVTINISKANAIAATVTENNRTYDGTEKPLVTVTGKATGGSMQYALGKDATTEPTSGWNTSIPTATNAGTYYVWYMVAGDSNHLDSEPECVKAYINKKIITYSNESGDGSEWKKGSDGSLEFVFKRSEDDEETFVHFIGVKVDETAVAAKHYDAKPGSVIITLKPEFIKTLAVGKHTLTAMFDDGNDVTVTFWILADEKKGSKTDGQKEEVAKRTSDDTPILLPVLIMIYSFAAAIYIMLLKKKTGK